MLFKVIFGHVGHVIVINDDDLYDVMTNDGINPKCIIEMLKTLSTL